MSRKWLDIRKIRHFIHAFLLYILLGDFVNNVLDNLPTQIKSLIVESGRLNELTEIRLRVGKNIYLYYGLEEIVLTYIVSKIDLINILKNISSNSIYSVQQEINNGFVTITGGHRIGVVGELVLKDGIVTNVKNISSMNIRIAREHIGISEKVLEQVLVSNSVLNTVILSPPLCGKTTLLRDLARSISNFGNNVCIVDERGEIAPMCDSKCVLDVGDRTDVISGGSKEVGIRIAVRSMAPDVICIDEIGTKADAEALKYLSISGVNFIATMHGKNINDLLMSDISNLVKEGYISRVILLSNNKGIGTIENIYTDLSSNFRP